MMNFEWILIFTFSILISASGIIINLIKQGSGSHPFSKSPDKTLLYFRVFIPLALITAWILYLSGIGDFAGPRFLVYFSTALILFGFSLRIFAVWYLGNSFTVNVQTTTTQILKRQGPFRFIRHPSYTGLLLYYLGLGLLMHNMISLLILTIVPIFIVCIRIDKEEKILLMHFGKEYEEYQKSVKRLIPFVY